MRRKKDVQSRAAEAAETAKPYVKRLIEDDELRSDLRDAYESARDAYDRVAEGKGPATTMLEDRKLQDHLRDAAESLRSATEALKEPEKKRRKGGLGKVLLVAIIAAIIAVVLSEDLRRACLDRLFGAEEEFEYTSTTAPAQPPPAS